MEEEFGDKLHIKYKTFENYGHVPFPSFYDGLKFVIEKD